MSVVELNVLKLRLQEGMQAKARRGELIRILVAALNAGLAECSGDWILRMDADDLSHRRRVEVQLATAMEFPDACVVACGASLRNSKSGVWKTWSSRRSPFARNLGGVDDTLEKKKSIKPSLL